MLFAIKVANFPVLLLMNNFTHVLSRSGKYDNRRCGSPFLSRELTLRFTTFPNCGYFQKTLSPRSKFTSTAFSTFFLRPSSPQAITNSLNLKQHMQTKLCGTLSTGEPQSAPTVNTSRETITTTSVEQFKKCKIVVSKIESVELHPSAESLYVCQIGSFRGKKYQLCAGLRK